jgi:hypothetical protein
VISIRLAPRAGRAALLLACGLCLLACSEEEPDCVRLQSSCDISQPHCQREIFAATACTRGQSGAKMPAIRGLTKAQYEDELREQADEEEDYGELAWGRALALFGLIPSEQSLAETRITQAVKSVAAYYSSETKKVTIIRDNTVGNDSGTFTLSHEFVHALQDQREDLSALSKEYADNSDSLTAFKCLVEGEATMLSNLTMPQVARGGANQVRWHAYFGAMRDGTLADLAEDDAPLFGARSLVYPVGGLGVARAYLGGGLRGIAALYEEPTITFLGWAKPSERSSEPVPLDCQPPEPPDGFERRFHDQHGMLGLLALYVALGLGPQYDEAQAWAGDSFAVYTPIEEDSEEVAVAWHIRFQDQAGAEALMDALPETRAITAERSGAEVMLRAASAEALLEDWPSEACASDEKSRQRARPSWVVPRSVTRWREQRHMLRAL